MGVKSQVTLIIVLVLVLVVADMFFIALFLDFDTNIKNRELSDSVEVESSLNMVSFDPEEDLEESEEEFNQITEEQAIKISLNELDGEVIDVKLKRISDEINYVVRVEVNGIEYEVVINRESGEVLDVERE